MELTIEEACASILGDQSAHAMIADVGLLWTVAAAMAKATTRDDPRALAAIRMFNAAQKRPSIDAVRRV